jgi:hypothetical protein
MYGPGALALAPPRPPPRSPLWLDRKGPQAPIRTVMGSAALMGSCAARYIVDSASATKASVESRLLFTGLLRYVWFLRKARSSGACTWQGEPHSC